MCWPSEKQHERRSHHRHDSGKVKVADAKSKAHHGHPGAKFVADRDKTAIFRAMISLRDDFDPVPDKPCMPAVAPEDIEFWRDVFSVLAPPPESDEVSNEQEG